MNEGGCFDVCVTSLKFAPTAPICLYDAAIMSLLTHFRSEPLPVGQICQSKGRGRINIISVESGPNVSPLLLSCLSHLGQERLFASGTAVVMGRLEFLAVVIIPMCWDIQVASAWYVVYFWKKMFLCLLYVIHGITRLF